MNGVTANTYTYDADDRLGSDQYDPDGNTINSFGTANTYDFENHLATHGGVTIVYDGDGNRVSETTGGVTMNYLVDTQNPTGYAQVVDELQGGTVARTYSFGLERISETQMLNSVVTTSFYGYDGHGSVRQLTTSTGSVTDTYDYDAFGAIVDQTGSTPNNYLFAGEEYDPALSLYYNRSRYLNTTTGRFWTMDSDEGQDKEPLTLHKYLYADANPVDGTDPSGFQDSLAALSVGESLSTTLDAMPTVQNPLQPGGQAESPQLAGELAQTDAATLIQDAISNALGGDLSLFRKYFRSAAAPIVSHVIANYGILSAGTSLQITFIRFTSADPTKYATSQRFGPPIIYLAQGFFAAPELGRDSRAGTIVHELSHIMLGTYDYAFGTDVLSLPLNKALYNGDTYEFYAEDSAQ